MSRSAGMVAIVAATILGVPYLFYALLYRGLAGYLWVAMCVLGFVFLVNRFKHGSLNRLLLVAAVASVGVTLASFVVKSLMISGWLLLAGLVVFGLASVGVYHLSRARISGNG